MIKIIKNITGTVSTAPRILANERIAPHLSLRLKECVKNRLGDTETTDYLINIYGKDLRFSRLRSIPVGTPLRLTFVMAEGVSVVQFTPLIDEEERYTERHRTSDVRITLRKPRRICAAA